MPKYSLKRLTDSDLTVFADRFRRLEAGGDPVRQKAINLNSNPFVDRMFPGLAGIDRGFQVRTTIVGPGRGAAFVAVLTLGKVQKNWRLGSVLVGTPVGEPGRFDRLRAGDIAIMRWNDGPLPTDVELTILSQDNDPGNWATIQGRFNLEEGNRSMVSLDEPDFARVDGLGHETEADVAETGTVLGADGPTALWPGRRRSKDQIEELSRRQEEIGRLGEELYREQLQRLVAAGGITGFLWISENHAGAPFDFEIGRAGELADFEEVKTTTGAFATPFYMSVGELRAAAEAGATGRRYLIIRVSDAEGNPVAQPLTGIDRLATEVLRVLEGLPEGVQAGAVRIDPRRLLALGIPIDLGPNPQE